MKKTILSLKIFKPCHFLPCLLNLKFQNPFVSLCLSGAPFPLLFLSLKCPFSSLSLNKIGSSFSQLGFYCRASQVLRDWKLNPLKTPNSALQTLLSNRRSTVDFENPLQRGNISFHLLPFAPIHIFFFILVLFICNYEMVFFTYQLSPKKERQRHI